MRRQRKERALRAVQWVTAAVLLLAIGWQVVLPYARDLWFGPAPSQAIAAEPAARVSTLPIGEIRLGMRLAGRNPLRQEVQQLPEPDPATWREVVLRMTKPGGRLLHVRLLRPVDWLAASGAEEGSTIRLDLPEMGAEGAATVEEILPCPPIVAGNGNVVTGTFAHEAGAGAVIASINFANGARIEGVTSNHPIWSIDARAFVPAGDLAVNARVLAGGQPTTITRHTNRPARPGEMVYNLEVHNEHVYQVTTAGVLVHNSCDIAFSISKNDEHVRFAKSVNAKHWKQWLPSDFGVTTPGRWDPTDITGRGEGFHAAFITATEAAPRIHVNVRGLDMDRVVKNGLVWTGIDNVTNWEVMTLLQRQPLQHKLLFHNVPGMSEPLSHNQFVKHLLNGGLKNPDNVTKLAALLE